MDEVGEEPEEFAEVAGLAEGGEGAGVFPVAEADAVVVGSTAEIDDQAGDDESDDEDDCEGGSVAPRRQVEQG